MFMFPADPLNSKVIDEYFKPQAEALSPDGYCLFSLEDKKVSGSILGQMVVYRGWMLNPEDYWTLYRKVDFAGGHMLTSPLEYFNAHHIPLWVGLLREYTAKTVVFTNAELEASGFDLVSELKKLGWEKFFLKDFVKSLKTAGGSVVNTPKDAPKVMKLMEKYRGSLEGGLCVRQFEELHDERRYFIINHRVFWPKNYPGNVDMLDILDAATKRIDSPFFSIDIAFNQHDVPRVVELGDGQVSDLVGWTPQQFAEVWSEAWAQPELKEQVELYKLALEMAARDTINGEGTFGEQLKREEKKQEWLEQARRY